MSSPLMITEFLSALGLQSLYVLVIFSILAIPLYRARHYPHWEFALWILVMLRFILPVHFSLPFSIVRWIQSIGVGWRIPFFFGGQFSGSNVVEPVLSNASHPLFGWPAALNTTAMAQIGVWSILWSCGAIMITIIFLVRFHSYRRILRRGKRVRERYWLEQGERLRQRLGIRRCVSIITAPSVESPFTMGILKPMIFIPENVLESNDTRLKEAVLTHEFIHIQRYDQLFNYFLFLILIFFFFHPVAWLMSRRMMLCRETLCDQQVLKNSRLSPSEYGTSLIAALGLSQKSRLFSGISGFGFAASQIHYRIIHLKGGMSMKKHKQFVLIVAALVLLPMAGQSNSSAQDKPLQPFVRSTKTVDLVAPIRQGRISARFGPMIDPFKKIERHHKGIDIAADTGTALYAAAEGKVVFVQKKYKEQQGYGKNVIIDHGSGVQTRYAKMEKVLVNTGDTVSRGQKIGEVGSTGISTGPHLHFELKMGSETVNPENHIDFSGLN